MALLMDQEQLIRDKYTRLSDIWNEKQKRLWAASEAISLGYGGVSIVHRATGLSRPTIHFGINELQNETLLKGSEDIRHVGGGRYTIEQEYPLLLSKLRELIEDHTKGDPTRALFWTNKSTGNLVLELRQHGYQVSDQTIARLLHQLGFSLQSNRKAIEGEHSEERDLQFIHINETVKDFQNKGEPVISIDAKKKELIGNFKNCGQEWHPIGRPTKVSAHDFMSGHAQKKTIPYGIYDISWNTGWVNVGVDHDTAEFAVESIRKWWIKMGHPHYPRSQRLLIVADSGGSNSSRGRLWKLELQKLADETGLEISVCHLPPGTSKWNKIEHRLFCHITKNWRGRPLTSYEVVVNLISHTKTKKGLKVFSELDEKLYPLAKKVSKADMGSIEIHFDSPYNKRNYTISPHQKQ